MEQTNEACEKVLRNIRDALACGVVDLDQQKMLGFAQIKEFAAGQKEVAMKAVIKLFRGDGAKSLAAFACEQLVLPDKASIGFNELQVAFENRFYFAKTIQNGNVAILLVTKEKTNIGMAWVQLRSIIPLVEPLLA